MRKSFLLVALAALLVLAGAVSAQEQVLLRLWTGASSPVENEFKTAQVEAFMAANPTITVDLLVAPAYGTLIQSALASGDYPDVFTVGQFDLPSYVDSGVLMPAGDYIENPDDLYPGLVQAFTGADGEVYGVPKDFSTLALLYNKDLFDAAGVEYPSAEWTWDDMYAAAEAITNADNAEGVVGFSAAADINRWLAFFYGNGAMIAGEDGMSGVNSPEGVAALDFYSSFVRDGIGALPSDLNGSGWNGEAFGRGLAGMTVEGNWAIGYLNDSFPEVNWGVAEIPLGPEGTRSTLTFTEAWAVGANTDHPEEAWMLVNFLTGTEGAASVATAGFGVMPARMSAADSWLTTRGEAYQAYVTGAEYAVAPVFPLGFGDFNTAFGEATNAVMSGAEGAQEALDAVAETWNEIQAES